MPTPFYETIESQIAGELQFDYGYRNLHSYLQIQNMQDETTILVPHESIVTKYKYYLEPYTHEVELDDQQYEYFRCNPQAFSEFVYGTTQYWALILELNHCKSRMDFCKKTVRFYDPLKITELLNEILLKESKS